MVIAEASADVLIQYPIQGYSEERRYPTYIFRSNDGTEKRRSGLHLSTDGPLRSVRYPTALLGGREIAYFQNIITNLLEGSLLIPFWLSMTQATQAVSGTAVFCDTQNLEFGSVLQVLCLKADLSNYEYRTISSVASDRVNVTVAWTGSVFVSGDWVIPLTTMIPARSAGGISVPGVNPFHSEVDFRFEELTGNIRNANLSTPAQLGGVDIFDLVPEGWLTETFLVDGNVIGDLWQARARTVNDLVERSIRGRYRLKTVAARREMTDFFDSKSGMQDPLWVRSRRADFVVYEQTAAGVSIKVTDTAEAVGLANITRWVYIPSLDSYHRISSVSDDSGYNTLTVTPATGATIEAGERLENCYYARFAQDVLRTDTARNAPDITVAAVSFRELQRETPTS